MSDFNINTPTSGIVPYPGGHRDHPDGYMDYLNTVDTSGFSTYIPEPDTPPLMPRNLLHNSVKTSLPLKELKRIIEEALNFFRLRYEFYEKHCKYYGYCKSSNDKVVILENALTEEKTIHTLYVECMFQVQIYQDHDGMRAVEVSRVIEHSATYTHVFQAIKKAIEEFVETP